MMLWNIYFQLIRAPCKAIISVSDSRVNGCSNSNGDLGSPSSDLDSNTSSNGESEGVSSILAMTLLKIVTVVL